MTDFEQLQETLAVIGVAYEVDDAHCLDSVHTVPDHITCDVLIQLTDVSFCFHANGAYQGMLSGDCYAWVPRKDM